VLLFAETFNAYRARSVSLTSVKRPLAGKSGKAWEGCPSGWFDRQGASESSMASPVSSDLMLSAFKVAFPEIITMHSVIACVSLAARLAKKRLATFCQVVRE
jgi:hypothetical protein